MFAWARCSRSPGADKARPTSRPADSPTAPNLAPHNQKMPFVTHRLALTIHSLEYHWCAVSMYFGMGPRMPSCLFLESKKQLLRPSSTSPLSLSTSAYMMKRPSLSRGPGLRTGLSPHRTVMAEGVLSTTSKWSVIRVPGS